MNGDIVGVIEHHVATGLNIVDRLGYSMFGVPRLLPSTLTGTNYGADLDNDNDISNGLHPDGAVDINDLLAFLPLFENGDPRADVADITGWPIPDNAVDINDFLYFLNQFSAGTSGTSTDHRFAWRGYQWDPYLNLYQVRNRTFDPSLISWLQPDPLGNIDGPNVYAYVGWDPFNRIDPYGLWGWDGDWIQYGIGGLLGLQGGQTAQAGWQGAHDGLVVTTNVTANVLSGGHIGATRNQLAGQGALYDASNPWLVASEMSGQLTAGTVVATIVFATGGAAAPALTTSWGGVGLLSALTASVTDIGIQEYEVRDGTRRAYSAKQNFIATGFGFVLGAGLQRLSDAIVGRLTVVAAESGVSVPGRIAELKSAIPAGSQGRITMAVGVVEDANGVRSVLIGTSEPKGYLRPGVTLKPGETMVPGTGHAEEDIVNYANQNGLKIIDIGATRPVCPDCLELIKPTGANISTPVRGCQSGGD